MTRLDEFIALLTGSFSNKEQYNSLRKAERSFPYAKHISTARSDKVGNLPLDFPGKSMVEEGIYEVNNERHASSCLFLFAEKPEGALSTSYEISKGSNKVGFSYKSMTTTDSLHLELFERLTPALFREKNGAWEGDSVNMFTPVMRFQLPERSLKDCLKISETIEVNGKRTFGCDQPILHKRVPEQTAIEKPYPVNPANCFLFL